MKLTLLGTGEVTGVPPMFLDLEVAGANARRRRPGLLVETAEATVLCDVSPDVREQVRETETTDLDAAFLTHFHHDHAGGIDELGLVADHVDVDIYMTETAVGHLEREREYLLDHFRPRVFAHGEPIEVADLEILPFPVAHGRPAFDTVGFAIYHDDAKAVYAPDIERFCPDRRAGTEYRDADVLFVEGASFYRPGLFDGVTFDELAADASADRTVLVHVNEYVADETTETMEAMARGAGYELGQDFETYSI